MSAYNRATTSGGAPPRSLEASLDEENKKVLASLDRTQSASPEPRGDRGGTPPPYRSMLDVGPAQPRHGSIAGIGVGVTSPRNQRKPSARLDPGDPSTWTSPAKNTSPTTSRISAPVETVGAGSQGLPRIQIGSKQDFEKNFNFDIASMSTSRGGAKPTQEKIPRKGSNNGRGPSIEWTGGLSEMKGHGSAYRRGSPHPAMLNAGSPQSKGRALSGDMPEGARRRLSSKSNSFSTIATDESDEASQRVLEDEEGDENALAESSSSDEERRGQDSDGESPESQRGRRRSKDENEKTGDDVKETVVEKKEAPQSQGVRSMIEPLLSPSLPKETSGDVHPPSSFGRSGPTAADFADEDEVESDIQKAKRLGMSISPVDDSIRDRHVRMIIRGEWSKFQDENENNNSSRPRLYLACTDLSTEASYAMEWTVGTMLRDGDTLLAIYAIEDENAPAEPENNTQVMNESAKAAQDASDAMVNLTRQTTDLESIPGTKFVPAIEAPSSTGSINMKNLSAKEAERVKALDEIERNFLKLVRKTPLQVRCMVEVIHCKSPKHLILNAIDTLDPTLCVVGTRGRSSLKGVLLGSFSNYLVTKSSVPVMVARKRLKKPSGAKVNSTSIKMSNNLTNSLMQRSKRGLTGARID